MTFDIYACCNCGQKNRVNSELSRASMVCARCRAPIFPAMRPVDPSVRFGERTAPKGYQPVRGAWRSTFFRALRVLFAIIAVIALINWINASDGSPNSSPASMVPTEPLTKDRSPATAGSPPLPSPVRQSAGIIYNRAGETGHHPFEIITSLGSDYFIKLVDAVSGDERIGIFVIGGQRIEVSVPTGRYKMRYASGETWRGLTHLFGPGNMTAYSATSDIFNFDTSGGYYHGYTIELIRQIDGNMSTYDIPASSF